MATVYLAHDLKHDRDVVIKVLKPELARSIAGERFLREIAITARLNHPHVLPLLDSGAANDGEILYYVMPVVTGESLRERLRRDGAIPLADALRLCAEVAEALAYAHEHGVVHRDVKPDNVMLSGDHAIVVDFGIAKAVGQFRAGETLTSAGMSLGTPAYMAPEQASGAAVHSTKTPPTAPSRIATRCNAGRGKCADRLTMRQRDRRLTLQCLRTSARAGAGEWPA